MKKIIIPVLSLLILTPLITSAQLGGVQSLILSVMGIVRLLIVLVAGLSLLAFMWGLTKFIFKVGGDEKAIEGGKNLMKWGLLALFVMMAVWGIIGFFENQLGLDRYRDRVQFPWESGGGSGSVSI